MKTMIAIGVVVAGLAAQPALATEWIYCNDVASTVTVGLLLGSEPMAVAGIILSHEDTVWASATAYGPGDPVALGQGFESDKMLFADLVDGNSVKLAELRLMKATEADAYASGGTLTIVGKGAWPVVCEGP